MKTRFGRHRNLTVAALLATIGLVGIAACSGDNSGGSESTKDVTLTMQYSLTPEDAHKVLQDYADQYEQETGVTVELSYVPWESQRTTTLSKIASGQAPDILHGNSNQGSSEFVEMGAMADLTDLISPELQAELVPTAFDEFGRFGIPFVQSPEVAIFYRPAMFEEAGVTPPDPAESWTWDEFVEAAKALTKDTDGDGTIDQWGFAERGLAGFIAMKSYIPHLWAFDADLIAPDGDGWKSGLGTPQAEAAISAQIELVRDQKVMPPNYITWGLAEAQRAWGDNSMAMFNVGMWWASSVNTEFGHEYGKDFDVMAFPVGGGGSEFAFATYDYFHIPQTSDNKEEAYKFIEWILLDPKRTADFAVADFNLPPTTKSALADERFSESVYPLWSERFALWADQSRFMPASSQYAGLWTETVIPIWEEMVTGSRSVEDGVAVMNEEVTALLGG
ncbi:MAG: sugar ABC transporter substrate-binding protein [Propionibacteriaceae bacterium]|jgi:multiple sugar transport system substrate-binding protein|nr:sugar ABC transporter substrate-binding protein [Propionibacteriaceae bacterium]